MVLNTLIAALILIAPLTAQARPPMVSGIASYYGWREHGRTMANGHKFNARGLSAASRTLPLGARIRVTRISNGRHVVLRVTDRGPYAKGRILDLSLGAAKQLGMLDIGVAQVRIDIL